MQIGVDSFEADCGLKVEKVRQLSSKAPSSERLEDTVGLARESAAVRRVARQFVLAASMVRDKPRVTARSESTPDPF